jgi:hypothetical protein
MAQSGRDPQNRGPHGQVFVRGVEGATALHNLNEPLLSEKCSGVQCVTSWVASGRANSM